MSKEKPTTTSSGTERFRLVKKNEHFNVLDLVNSSELMDTSEEQHSYASAVYAETSRNASGLSENQDELATIKEGEPIIDGVMCLGRTWNIVEAPLETVIYDKLKVVVRPNAFYNGLPEVTGFPFHYEIPFADIEDATLSLLIVSDINKCITSNGHLSPIHFDKMSSQLLGFIKDGIRYAGGKSLAHLNYKRSTTTIVYKSEWKLVGRVLAEKYLSEPEYFNKTFPIDARFYFVIKGFGQNLTYGSTESCDFYHTLNMDSVDRLSIYVGVDYEPDDEHILFFNSKFAEHMQCGKPDYKYNPCLVPEAGEYLYSNLPPNDFNVLALRQYTRLFPAIDRNENWFFYKSFIAETLFKTYLDILYGVFNKPDHVNGTQPILVPELADLRDETLELLKSKAPVKSRFEFVWSRDLSAELSSFPQYQSVAVDQCLQFMRTGHCANNKRLFKVHPRSPICEYLTYQLETCFNTILSAVETLRTVALVEEPTKIVEASASLILEDFAAVLLSEAVISRLSRGTFDGFPDFICELVMQEQNTERCILKWPFDEHKIREQQGFLIVTDICITKCFPHQVVHDYFFQAQIWYRYISSLSGAFRHWKSIPVNATLRFFANAIRYLFTDLINHFLQKLLLHNCMQPTIKPYEALRKIWDSGALHRHHEAETHSTSSLYGRLLELSKCFSGDLQIPLLMLELAKMELDAKLRGGAGLSVAMIMDDLMYKAGVPFILRLEERIIQIVYVPYTLPQTKSPEPIIGIYQQAFKVSFGRSMGRAGIHVDTFLVPLVTHIQSLKMDYRPKHMGPIFKLVNNFLDNDNAKKSSAFGKLSAGIRNILLAPYYVEGQEKSTQMDVKQQQTGQVSVSNKLDLFFENKMEVDDAELIEPVSKKTSTERLPSCSSHSMPLSTERSEASVQALASVFNEVTIHNSDTEYGDDDEGCEDSSILRRGYLFRRNRQIKTHTLCDNLVFEGDSFA